MQLLYQIRLKGPDYKQAEEESNIKDRIEHI